MKLGGHGVISGYDMVQMAHAICDADPTLEDFKHGYRCSRVGCQVPHDICVAWRQARAAIEALGLVWAPRTDVRLKPRKPKPPPPPPPPEPEPEAAAGPRPDYAANRMIG
jgi:hypothetical protein